MAKRRRTDNTMATRKRTTRQNKVSKQSSTVRQKGYPRNSKSKIKQYTFYFFRCVDKATCEKEWINESADLDYCKQYGAVQNPAAFECHFCCVGDGCNSNLVPSSSTWYTKNHHD